MLRVSLGLFFLLTSYAIMSTAQESTPEQILFVWNDTIYAQSIAGVLNTVEIAPAHTEMLASLPLTEANIYAYEDSPLTQPPADNYGFHQGVWSDDRTRFAYLAIQHEGAGFRVEAYIDGVQSVLIAENVMPTRGYLIPIAWQADGRLLLLERHTLYTLDEVRIWQWSPDSTLTFQQTIPIPSLKGNTATLSDGRVFLGFDTVGAQGYILNSNMSLAIFPTGFVLQDPPASVFEIYPVQVLGVSTASAFDSVDIPLPQEEAPIALEPFLHWMLPDFARSVTCYADSAFTDSIYEVECPGLQTPRAYAGHEGTDVGGRPAGLPIGTPVYATSAGMVIKTLSTCGEDDITCGDAYGNYVLLEHTRVRDYNTQTWFTGYAHLQSVLVEENTFVDYIGTPIALSGASGLGGAHLHFEVRAPHLPISTNWVDPYDTNTFESDTGLWIVADGRPLAAPIAFPPPILLTCQSPTGNNIRSGPGTNYDVVTQTTENTIYEVTQIQTLTTGAVPGDWYQIQWDEGASTGWLWSELMTGCAEVDN